MYDALSRAHQMMVEVVWFKVFFLCVRFPVIPVP